MMDLVLEAWVSGAIELSKMGWVLGAGAPWTPGEKLRLLFAGYNGTRNTGSDLRVHEMLRQVRRILGEQAELSVMTQNFEATRGYFGDAIQVHLPDIFPPFLWREVPRHHGVVACEGSMFKSKFANALTAMMIGSLGIAAARNGLSIGYGGDADHMDPLLAAMCRRFCRQSLVITRNEESRRVLAALDIPTELGTDTGWTFEPHGAEYSHGILRAAGWDGRTPVLALCPINPFFWPVKPSLAKYLLHGLFGAYKKSHYRTVYFHNAGPEVDVAYERYLAAWAGAVGAFRTQHDVFPILVGTERLDADACRRLAERLGGTPIFTSDQYDIYQLVSILRAARLMVSSRYHAVVTSMPALVPSAGVTMDERIRNLMRERGHMDLLATVNDPDLEPKILAMLEKLAREGEAIAGGIGSTVVRNLKVMARMGTILEEQVLHRYPEFPVRQGPLSWEDYLPPLSPELRKLVEAHGG